MKLKDKIAIVTGGGSGIGRATAERFAADGASVMVADLDGDRAKQVAADVDGSRARAVQVDVTSAEQVRRLVADTVEAFGGLDVLVSNAGIVTIGTAATTSEADWDRVLAVNAKGGFLCSKYAIPELRRRGGGVILLTASTIGIEGFAGQLAYAASKAAVVAMTRCMALDHAQHNIRVNCVCPGPVDTPLSQQMVTGLAPEERSALAETMPVMVPLGGAPGQPDQIASALAFLASDDASFVTGHALVVDGGQLAGHFVPALVED
jgi:meso-butanediol dehydrogenase / (S,S)-butanediol dehydrogenase / diacetyl reductase